jgi:hypothetical protein
MAARAIPEVRSLRQLRDAEAVADVAAEAASAAHVGTAGQAMEFARRAGRTLWEASTGLAIPLAIGQRMADYGDFGNSLRYLASLNEEPLDKLDPAAEPKLAADPALLLSLYDEGRITDALYQRLKVQ